MKAILLVVSWIQAGPYIQVQPLETLNLCQVTAEATIRMIAAQAKTNMTSAHGDLIVEKEEVTGDWRLMTGTVRREVSRISCVLNRAS